MKPKWIVGPPTARGSYWIVWLQADGRSVAALPVAIEPALIYIKDEKAALLIKFLGGGGAHDFEGNKTRITHHMPMVAPEVP